MNCSCPLRVLFACRDNIHTKAASRVHPCRLSAKNFVLASEAEIFVGGGALLACVLDGAASACSRLSYRPCTSCRLLHRAEGFCLQIARQSVIVTITVASKFDLHRRVQYLEQRPLDTQCATSLSQHLQETQMLRSALK
jgi:hypothetical protein